MSLVTPPAPMPIKRIQWTLTQSFQVNRSGWSGNRQVSTRPGKAMWSCSGEFIPIRGQDQARKWIGFFNSLEGQVNTFPVVAVETAQHGWANPVAVSGAAGATSMTLGSVAAMLLLGHKMTVKLSDGSYQLVVLTSNVTGATVNFKPALRLDAATGVGSLETVYPFCHVALTGNNPTYSVDPGQIYSFAFDAEEAF